MIATALDMADGLGAARDARSAGLAFADALAPYGLTALTSRLYRRPRGPLSSDALMKAGGFLAMTGPAKWDGSAAQRYVCLQENPLLDAVQRRRSHFRFSDYAPKTERRFRQYWDAFSEAKVGDGLGLLWFGPDDHIGSLSLAFERMAFSPQETSAIRLAGMMAMEQIAQLSGRITQPPRLTPRERDCTAYVAAGKSDWEISVILGLGETTVRFHVDNARRKLGATNRAHLVARLASFHLL